MIQVVTATRLSEADFWRRSPLGVSLRRLRHDPRLIPRPTFLNRRGLPEVYNERIVSADPADTLAFVHDDVWIDDYYLADRLTASLRPFDVVGVVGSRRRVPGQPSWRFLDAQFTTEAAVNLSGSIAHGDQPFGRIASFGHVGVPCELLDGVFLAARAAALRQAGVFFDPRFDFHFYDLDFCRTARLHGLRLGTWPICLTHRSGGGFESPEWGEKYRDYLAKWTD